LRLDVDDDDPRRASDPCATDGIEPNASGPEDHHRVAGPDVGGVQDGAGASDHAAAEQRSLGERQLLGYDGKLVLVNERLLGEAPEPKAVEQADPIAAEARCIGRTA